MHVLIESLEHNGKSRSFCTAILSYWVILLSGPNHQLPAAATNIQAAASLQY